ncbi:DUF6308 family protein [Actinoplanes sp. NPDC048796]|uniref:DUF6308 family protein n=1 Tax=Actinoplanes sp. NPDC048796 TaxID=3155640 RepID=UPI0033EFA912
MQSEELVRLRIEEVLATPAIGRLVERYFDPEGPFAGATFDLLGQNPPHALTLDDLLATSLLDITWRPLAVRRLLAADSDISARLAAIPGDVDLWNAPRDVLETATFLHSSLSKLPGIGPVIASKLLARKRPRLVPIHDRVVLRVLAPPKNKFWETLAAALRAHALREGIEALRPAHGGSASLLRLLDVAIWTRHSRSRAAQAARAKAGVSEPTS